MPNATEAELREATENFRAYMAVVLGIYERVTRLEVPTLDSPEIESGDRFGHDSPNP
jgi:hypothetical protein